jgi:hypothetical protein
MATRKSRNASRSTQSRTAHDVDAEQYQQAAQQGTQKQVTLAVDATSAVLRGAEIWSQLQLRAIQRSSQAWREAAEQLREANGPLAVMGVQNQLITNTLVQGFQLAQDMMQAAVALQPAAASRAQDEAAGSAETFSAMMQAPIMQAWQNMLNPMSMNGAANASARH